ncbi:hypothetical protein [Miniphocaeibacter massiliensis]|uniref:hypothetical protein n=1 Tax=Miniphocaeibacter massiliensis TaxID=2041841 RepID=UPI00101AD441|nr:hypothetical protein [Miniphocaeibacter massiliensis]
MKKYLLILAMTMSMVFVVTACKGKDDNDNIKETLGVKETKTSESSVVDSTESLEDIKEREKYHDICSKFLYLKKDMKKEEVDSILGEKGKETLKSKRSTIYEYYGKVQVTFRDDKLCGKNQSDLITSFVNASNHLSLKMFEQVKEGMSVDEVKDILGDGVLTSEDYLNNFTTSAYVYYGEDNTNIRISFNDGVVAIKTQLGLE